MPPNNHRQGAAGPATASSSLSVNQSTPSSSVSPPSLAPTTPPLDLGSADPTPPTFTWRYFCRPRAFDWKWRRKSGFQEPYAIHFMILWVILVVTIALTFGFTLPLIPSFPLMVATYIVSTALVLLELGVIYAVVSTNVESRATRRRKRDAERQKTDAAFRPMPSLSGPAIDSEGFCKVDGCFVSRSTRHCQYCNVCVSRYDHHCLFLNCCIGGRNFQGYLVAIVLGAAGTALWDSMTLYVLAKSFTDQASFAAAASVYRLSPAVACGVLVALSVELSVLWSALMCLLVFHVWLVCRGMTTYEWTVGGRKGDGGRDEKGGCCNRQQRKSRDDGLYFKFQPPGNRASW